MENDLVPVTGVDGESIATEVDCEKMGELALADEGVACVKVGDGSFSSIDRACSSSGIMIRSIVSGATPKLDWLYT